MKNYILKMLKIQLVIYLYIRDRKHLLWCSGIGREGELIKTKIYSEVGDRGRGATVWTSGG